MNCGRRGFLPPTPANMGPLKGVSFDNLGGHGVQNPRPGRREAAQSAVLPGAPRPQLCGKDGRPSPSEILKKAAAVSKRKPMAIVSYDEKPGIQTVATTAPDLPYVFSFFPLADNLSMVLYYWLEPLHY